MEKFTEVFIFLAFAAILILLIIFVGIVVFYLFRRYSDKKNITYIDRSNGKTRIVKDKNGNIIKVDNIKEL